jgi:hypothetical protein
MAQRVQSKGNCAFCSALFVKSGVTRHLSACPARKARDEKSERTEGKTQALYHLRVQAARQSQFWLDLEVCGSATLDDLDAYLRSIWLECCGHMSQFSVGGWRGEEIPMNRKISQVFREGVELTHLYDFGTTSESLIKAVGTREGKPLTRHPIVLMARNLMPEAVCLECGKPAKWLCMECMIDEETSGTLCGAHAKSHPHQDYGDPLPLANSPRMGMCAYAGPAKPPY